MGSFGDQPDAAFSHHYGMDQDNMDHIMETFPFGKGRDPTAHAG